MLFLFLFIFYNHSYGYLQNIPIRKYNCKLFCKTFDYNINLENNNTEIQSINKGHPKQANLNITYPTDEEIEKELEKDEEEVEKIFKKILGKDLNKKSIEEGIKEKVEEEKRRKINRRKYKF